MSLGCRREGGNRGRAIIAVIAGLTLILTEIPSQVLRAARGSLGVTHDAFDSFAASVKFTIQLLDEGVELFRIDGAGQMKLAPAAPQNFQIQQRGYEH
jgi:hypothetical protein